MTTFFATLQLDYAIDPPPDTREIMINRIKEIHGRVEMEFLQPMPKMHKASVTVSQLKISHPFIITIVAEDAHQVLWGRKIEKWVTDRIANLIRNPLSCLYYRSGIYGYSEGSTETTKLLHYDEINSKFTLRWFSE